MVFVAFVVFVGLGSPGQGLWPPDFSWPGQEFLFFVGQGLKLVVFSLVFVDFVVFVGLG